MLEEDIRIRIKDCLDKARKAGKFTGPTDLSQKVSIALERLAKEKRHTPGGKQTVSDQTASNWIKGRNIPDWEVLPALASVVGIDEDTLLFGSKRGEQLRRERAYLSRVSEEEAELLTMFREADKSGQRIILSTIKTIAQEHPAPEATVHPMRRRDDKIRS